MTDTPVSEAEIRDQADAMARLMNDDQRAQVVAALLLNQSITVLEAGNVTGGFHVVRSPFNEGYPMAVYGGKTLIAGEERFAAIMFDGDGTDQTPHIIAALYSDDSGKVAIIAPLDTADTPEHVSRVRKSVLAAIPAQTTEDNGAAA